MVLVAFGQLLAASLGIAVAIGELLVRPATCELVVGGGEIAHGSVREHDVNAPALPCAGVRSFRQRDAAGAAPYLLGGHGRMADRRDRAPPASVRGVWSSLRSALLLLAGAITSLTLEAGRGREAVRSA